jgi:diguanylate cyclase (GGDEF)-like protein/hemerythrin-like metal-binding protein
LLCTFFLLSSHAFAADKALDARHVDREAVSLTEYFAVLEDPAAALTLANVTQPEFAGRFKTGQAPAYALGFSYTQSAIWLRLHLKNPGEQPVGLMLEIRYKLLAKVDLYQPDESGYRHVEAGYTRALSAQAYPSRFIAIPIQLPAGADQELYLRVQSPNSLNIPAQLWSMEAFHTYQPGDYSVQALYFGVVLAIAFYNLMLFFTLRDISYLIYVTFACCVAMALATFTGMGNQFIWGVTPVWTKIGVNVPAALASVAMLLFTRRMLMTAQIVPRLDQVIKLFIGINAAFFFLLMGWFWEFNRYFVAINLITSMLILGTGVLCAIRRQRNAYFFVAAFSVLFLANALSQLRNLGILPTNFFTSDSLQIGSTLEMLLLSLVLADRFNMMRREKLDAQALLIQAQGEIVEKLKASEQSLEVRVADRTAQLHSLNQQLEVISTTDALTGIANRRHFDAILTTEWNRAVRLGQSLALGMIDLDWFKKYNDHYGHQAGDECLRQVASVLTETFNRTGDLVARYGGEEFVFIAPVTDSESALRLGQLVCGGVQTLALPHEQSKFGCVTLSVGVVALIPQHNESPDMLVRIADEMLYRAKAQGRNRVVCDIAYTGYLRTDRHERPFAPLVWKDAFLCGNEQIDRQHKLLVQLANELFNAMLSERPDGDIAQIVANLLVEVQQHFHDEEVLLGQLGFTKLDQHATEHAQLLSQAQQLAAQFKVKELALGSLFEFLAHEVIIRHVLGSDREYFALIENPARPVSAN